MQQLHLSIPEPCHESWRQMTPTEQGRFCNACAKEVVDFSMMTDAEVLSYFINQKNEKVCGRALLSQLDRTITMPKEPVKKRFWYWNYITMFFLFFSKQTANAQGGVKRVLQEKIADKDSLNKIRPANVNNALKGKVGGIQAEEKMPQTKGIRFGDVEPVVAQEKPTQIRLGYVSSSVNNKKPIYVVNGVPAQNTDNINPAVIESIEVLKTPEATALYGNIAINGAIIITTKKEKTISCKIIDEQGNPLSFATVAVDKTKNGVASDANGNFTIKAPAKALLKITALGFETKQVSTDTLKQNQIIVLNANSQMLGEVVITSTVCTRRMGAMFGSVTIVEKKEIKIIDTIKNIFSPAIKIYPNPVASGNTINVSLSLKETGLFNLQVVNAAGQTVLQKQINKTAKEWTEQIAIDSRWSSGVYFIKIINPKNIAVSTQRFIAQ